jgi:hypothetical protein
MTVKSGGKTLLCGSPAASCSRWGHCLKRTTARDLGRPGIYLATSWNSNQSVLNAVEETLLTQEAWDASH